MKYSSVIAFLLLSASQIDLVLGARQFIDDGTGPIQVGDPYPINISSDDDNTDITPSIDDLNGPHVSKTYTLSHAGASFISVHFASMDLDPSCTMEISDEGGNQSTVMKGRGRHQLGTFWAQHVDSDTMLLTMYCKGNKKRFEFVIDEYVAGYPVTEGRRRNLRTSFFPDRDLAICDVDDKRNAKCFEADYPEEYGKAKAVAKLLIGGSRLCTGWLVGPNNLLLTNEHCITEQSEAANTDYQFMFEGASCGSNSVSGQTIFGGLTLLKDSYEKDYALIQLDGDAVSTFGYLDIENRLPATEEVIYIPQHPAGRDKELAILDSSSSDPNGRCNVLSTSHRNCGKSAEYKDVSYSCDTEGGSSGSPVISKDTGKVVALHHCGGACVGNLGVPIAQLYDEIADLVYPNTPAHSACTGGEVQFRLELQSDGHASETSWQLTDKNGNIVVQGSGYPNNALIEVTACLNPDDSPFTFTILDSWNDGICCDFGQGWYKLYYDDSMVYSSNGSFGSSDVFTIGGTASPPVTLPPTTSPPATALPATSPPAPPATPPPTTSPPVTQPPTPTPPVCSNDPSWRYRQGNRWKYCSFVAQEPLSRCNKVGKDGRSGAQACQCACNETPTPPTTPTAPPAIPPPTPTPPACSDDRSWRYRQGNRWRYCSFVARKPWPGCNKLGRDGRTGAQACQCACADT